MNTGKPKAKRSPAYYVAAGILLMAVGYYYTFVSYPPFYSPVEILAGAGFVAYGVFRLARGHTFENKDLGADTPDQTQT